MVSNTGGNDRDNSSTGTVFVGDPKCADETEVSVGVSVLSEAPANCARLDENAAAAKVPTMAESIVTYNPNLSSPASKFASAANEFDGVEASCDELVSGGSGPVRCEAQDTGPGGMVDVPSVGDGTVFGVSPPDKTKARNAEVYIAAPDAVSEVFIAAPDAVSMACVFDYSRPCNNVNDQPKPSSVSFIGTFGSADKNLSSSSSVMAGVNKEMDSCVLGASTLGGEVDGSSRSPVISQKPRQYFKKKSRKLCRKIDRWQTGNRKRSTFDHDQYHITMVTNQVSVPSNVTMATSTSNRGHSPTKAEVKKMNQHLIDENLHLKKDFHKADHRLKTLLADKKDLLRRLRLESKATNKLIESIHDETKDVMKRAQDILTKAAKQKKETELMVNRSKKDT
jgi:hypothetical protein